MVPCPALVFFQEAEEAEALMAAIMEKKGNTSMSTMAKHRQEEFDSFVASLEAKYAKGGSGKAKKRGVRPQEELGEEEFQKIQASIAKKGKKTN